MKNNKNSVHKKRIILVKTNLRDIDPRLSKEIDVLMHRGYSIILLCWDRECKTINNEQEKDYDDYKEIRLRLRAPCGKKILPFLPIWWCFELYWLLKLHTDIVHSINLDTIVPAIIASKIQRNNIIYEMFDTYEDEVKLPQIVRNFFVYIDKFFMHSANAVIIVDESRIKELNGIPNDNIVVIYNSPSDYIKKINKNNTTKDKSFTIFFAGILTKYRSIDRIIILVKEMENVKLVIAGYGNLVGEIKKLAYENPSKIKFLGKISHNMVIDLSMSADLLFSLYDPSIPLHKFASSNKLFEAMMCGKPILVSKNTSMDAIVRKENCGIVINYNDINSIRHAIIKLINDPKLCIKLGKNGRKAYEKKFNWKIMENRLLSIYKKLIND